jgi:hypothetical protein
MPASECPACHQQFTGLTAFDAHQDVDYGRRVPVTCRDPALLAMTTDRNGRWMIPASEADRVRLAALKARQ